MTADTTKELARAMATGIPVRENFAVSRHEVWLVRVPPGTEEVWVAWGRKPVDLNDLLGRKLRCFDLTKEPRP